MKDWDLKSDINNIIGMDAYSSGRSLPFNDIMIMDADIDDPSGNSKICQNWNEKYEDEREIQSKKNLELEEDEMVEVPEEKFFVNFIDQEWQGLQNGCNCTQVINDPTNLVRRKGGFLA